MKNLPVKKVAKKAKNTKKEVALAVLTIRDAAKIPDARRKEIGNWLRRQASFLLKSNKDMAERFTARFLV